MSTILQENNRNKYFIFDFEHINYGLLKILNWTNQVKLMIHNKLNYELLIYINFVFTSHDLNRLILHQGLEILHGLIII